MKLSFQLPGNSKAGTSEFEDIVIEHSIDICEDSIFYLLRETHNILFITIGALQLVHHNWCITIGSLWLVHYDYTKKHSDLKGSYLMLLQADDIILSWLNECFDYNYNSVCIKS